MRRPKLLRTLLALTVFFSLIFSGALFIFSDETLPQKSPLTSVEEIPAEKSYLVMSQNIFEERTDCRQTQSQYTYLSFKLKNIDIAVIRKMSAFAIYANNSQIASGRFSNLNSSLIRTTDEDENGVHGAFYEFLGAEKYGSYLDGSGTNLKLFCSDQVCHFTIILHDGQFGLPPIQRDAQYSIHLYERETLLKKVTMPGVPSTPPDQEALYAPVNVRITKNRIAAQSTLPTEGAIGAMRITWEDNSGKNERVFLFEDSKLNMEIKNEINYQGDLKYAAGLLYYELPNNHSYERKVVVKYQNSLGSICNALETSKR